MVVEYVVAVVAYTFVDRAAFVFSGAPTTRTRRAWTYWAVVGPYHACLVAPGVEIAAGVADPTPIGMIAGGTCIVIAAGLRWVGVTTLGRSFSASIETHDEHPLCLGLVFLFVGLPLFAGARLSWIAAEERWLAAHLLGCANYMQRTKRLVPAVW